MLISDPTLVIDISRYEPFVNPQEWIDGGVTDVIVKLGSGVDIDPLALTNCALIAKTSLGLHAYWWDDPILYIPYQLQACVNTIKKSGLTFKSIWLDQEQWWGDWNLWYQARRGQIPWGSVPAINANNLDVHYHNFSDEMAKLYKGGVYTGRGFITSWCPKMAAWLPGRPTWMAQYGHQMPAGNIEWNAFKQTWLPNYDPNLLNTGVNNIWGHQFTGDAAYLPGAYQDVNHIKRSAMDVSIFSKAKLATLGGVTPSPVKHCPTCGQVWAGGV